MTFNLEKFKEAEFAPRTEEVEIKQLAGFFGEGEKPVFVVRGLSAHELQHCLDAATKQNALGNITKAIATKSDQVDTIRKALGLTNDTPGETAKRLEMLVRGCVSPKMDAAGAAKLAEVCPIEFFELTNKITTLTGQGGSMVKQQPSSRKRQA